MIKTRLRDAITKVLSDEELKKRFGEDGRWLVREEFGWSTIEAVPQLPNNQ